MLPWSAELAGTLTEDVIVSELPRGNRSATRMSGRSGCTCRRDMQPIWPEGTRRYM